MWGDVVGGTMFVIFRNNAHFPLLPPGKQFADSLHGDEVTRGVSGMGPQRHAANADKPEESIEALEKPIARNGASAA